jgi:hypothetical protein
MLTDLSFLNIGEPFPPKEEQERLQTYNSNRLLFEGKHDEVYSEQFKRIQRVIGNFDQVISYHVLANFQKLLSLKVADLLLGEEPSITAGENESKEQQSINQIKENTDLINTAYQTVIDVSRYGDGLFLIYPDENGGMIDVTQPSIWFPVVNPDNIKKMLYHVLAWKVGNLLRVQIHSKGSYEEREYKLNDYNIIEKMLSSRIVQTGLTDFAVIQVPNTITSDRVHGLNDYDDVDSILSELEVRLSQIAKVLDKHTEPSMQGPSGALEYDNKTGQYKLKVGNYFPIEKEDGEVKYITWDAQLQANITYIEKLINLLSIISEMGSMIFNDFGNAGQIPSGSALRRMFISPLAKVTRIKMRFDGAMKKAIKLCSQLGGKNIVNLTDKDISIAWKDGLPGDSKEDAEIMQIRTANKATISQKTALMRFDNLSEEDAQAELDNINEDETRMNPVNSANMPFADANTIE